MKALVTGSAGFVGRRMVMALAERGFLVDGCDIASPVARRDARDLFREDTRRFDLVVHAAATAPHRAAIDGQPMNLAKDLQLDAAMFEWAVRTKQRRVVYLSSSAAYPRWVQEAFCPLSEDMLRVGRAHEPFDSYGWTKMTGERMAAAAKQAGIAVHVVRPFSGYGEDQGTEWPFGAFIARAARREDPFTIWGDGEQVRDWVHIDDIVGAILAMVEGDIPGPVNVCTGRGVSFNQLAQMVCEAVGSQPELKHLLDAPQGVAYRVGDPARLNTFYTPKVTLEDGIVRALQTVR